MGLTVSKQCFLFTKGQNYIKTHLQHKNWQEPNIQKVRLSLVNEAEKEKETNKNGERL